jgi:hypothetical protein
MLIILQAPQHSRQPPTAGVRDMRGAASEVPLNSMRTTTSTFVGSAARTGQTRLTTEQQQMLYSKVFNCEVSDRVCPCCTYCAHTDM